MASSSSPTTTFFRKGTGRMLPGNHGCFFRVTRTSCRTGLTVVTVELPHLHSVSVVMYARVGSRYETVADNGLSHFLEHMLFRGTERLPDAYALNHAIEALGGTLYAETGRDYSLYQISLHPETLQPGLELFGEIFAHAGVRRRRRRAAHRARGDARGSRRGRHAGQHRRPGAPGGLARSPARLSHHRARTRTSSASTTPTCGATSPRTTARATWCSPSRAR